MQKITKLFKKYKKYQEIINCFLTVLMIFVTCLSVFVTYQSTNATNSIKNIEVYLAKEKLKDQIIRQITLIDNILFELRQNNDTLNQLNDLGNLKASTEVLVIYIHKTSLVQASENEQFGNLEIKERLRTILSNIYMLEDDVNEVRNAQINNDLKVKSEHVGNIIGLKKKLIQNIDITIKLLEDYKKLNVDQLKNIDKELDNQLSKLS